MKLAKTLSFGLVLLCTSCGNSAEIEDAEEVVITKKFTGVKTTYHENGVPATKTSYKRDKKDGVCYNYYDNGNVKLEIEYKNGKKNGLFKWYYSSGQVYQIRNYRDNELNGEYFEYSSSGKQNFKKYYYNDQEMSDSY